MGLPYSLPTDAQTIEHVLWHVTDAYLSERQTVLIHGTDSLQFSSSVERAIKKQFPLTKVNATQHLFTLHFDQVTRRDFIDWVLSEFVSGFASKKYIHEFEMVDAKKHFDKHLDLYIRSQLPIEFITVGNNSVSAKYNYRG